VAHALAYKDGSRVRLISRQAVDHTDRFHELAAAITALKAPKLILDGEVCEFRAMGCTGRPAYRSCADRRAASDRRS
jgi:ATP-dependent DNA ligase